MASDKRFEQTVPSFSPSVSVERDTSKHEEADFTMEEVDVAGESCVTVYGRMQP